MFAIIKREGIKYHCLEYKKGDNVPDLLPLVVEVCARFRVKAEVFLYSDWDGAQKHLAIDTEPGVGWNTVIDSDRKIPIGWFEPKELRAIVETYARML